MVDVTRKGVKGEKEINTIEERQAGKDKVNVIEYLWSAPRGPGGKV